MKCFECSLAGERSDAVGVCQHCSVGLCAEHAVLTADPILTHQPIAKVVELPKKARALLCRTCVGALRQNRPIEEAAGVPAAMAHR